LSKTNTEESIETAKPFIGCKQRHDIKATQRHLHLGIYNNSWMRNESFMTPKHCVDELVAT